MITVHFLARNGDVCARLAAAAGDESATFAGAPGPMLSLLLAFVANLSLRDDDDDGGGELPHDDGDELQLHVSADDHPAALALRARFERALERTYPPAEGATR